MRIVAIVVVLAIVYFIYGRNGDKTSPQNRVAEAQAEAAQVAPMSPPPQPNNSLRAPADRTRQVLDQVKQRNGDGEF